MERATGASEKNRFQAGGWHFVALLGGNAALALGPWFVRLADTGPVAAGFWRMLLPLPLFAWLAWREQARGENAGSRRTTAILLAAGGFFALDLASWHVGIERTRLGNATLFGNSGSILLMLWGLVALRRWPRTAEWTALAAALAGAAILMGRSLDISTATLVGDLFCLLAGVLYVGYLLPAQAARVHVGQWTVLAVVSIAAAPVLLSISVMLGEPVLPGVKGWLPVAGLAISSQVVGQGLLVYSLRHFPPLIVGMALLTQPAIAAAVGWFAFGELLVPADILGMALVSLALVLARARTRVRVPQPGAPTDPA